MKRRFGIGLVAACGLAMLMTSGIASADQDEFNRRGFFIGLGASGMVPGFQGILGKADFGNTAGLNFHAGYRLNEYFALDSVFEYGADFGRSGKTRTIGQQVITRSSSIQTAAFTVGPKLILPLGRFQPYLDGGIGFINANGNVDVEDQTTGRTVGGGRTGSGFAGRFGGGVDVFVTPKWSLYVDNAYTIPAEGPTDVYYYSFGLGGRYNF
jgi:opacity protein-like surface antigen